MLDYLEEKDRKVVKSIIWEVLKNINHELNMSAYQDKPRKLRSWVKDGSKIADNEELMGLLPKIITRLSLRLDREISSGRSLLSGDAAYLDEKESGERE